MFNPLACIEEIMKPIEIKNDIFWIGAIDFESRDFHGYSRSPQGTTYNAYLVKGEKNVLFDSVREEHIDTMLEDLSSLLPPESVDYIVVNHAELDHSGGLPQLIAACKPEAVFCSPMGLRSLQGHFDCTGWPLKVVKTGDTLSLGSRTIHFMEARMLHWPDSMFSYIPEDKLLISNDAFGQNIACTERFVDELEHSVVFHAMREYYYNIILPFSPQVLKTLDQVASLGLDIDMIAPDHGLIYRTKADVNLALESYRAFAEQKPANRAVILYDTMWQSTEHMAHAICQGLAEAGTPAVIMNLKQNHHSAVMTELSRCGVVAVGSPTHNNGIMPSVAGMLTYMKGLRPQNRLGGAFGSYGWSGESTKVLSEWLTSMGIEQPVEPIKALFVPSPETLDACRAMGAALATALQKKIAEAGN